ncbi:hypothetical protein D3C85_1126420 [compost metagenome]
MPVSAVSTCTMLVCGTVADNAGASRLMPSLNLRARTWSSTSRSTMACTPSRPAAAMIPDCRCVPPSMRRSVRALARTAWLPASTAPTGALSPLDRQSDTVSAWRLMSPAGTPSATAALNMRAPSRCTGTPAARAMPYTACMWSSGSTVPPALLCDVSIATSDVFSLCPPVCSASSRRFRSIAPSVPDTPW